MMNSFQNFVNDGIQHIELRGISSVYDENASLKLVDVLNEWLKVLHSDFFFFDFFCFP